MHENFNFLFHYLEKENINIDKSEFVFQIQSHPDYPSLLAISDTLTFFRINNIALRTEIAEIEMLPKRFIALLSDENNTHQFHLIEEKAGNYIYIKNRKRITIAKQELELRWQNIVFFIEKAEKKPRKSKSKIYSILLTIYFISFLLVLLEFKGNLANSMFFIFSAFGILFSIAAQKDLFGTKSELISNFCNISASTNCDTITSSTKWRLFEWVNFSDLSIVFFTSQFLGLFTFILANNYKDFFAIQFFLLCCSVPVILLSLYFQKFVEKKWCPICLVIIGLNLLELSYLFLSKETNFIFSLSSLLLFAFVFLTISLIWIFLKKIFVSQKDLKEFQFKAIRFMRNYDVFKNTLLTSRKIAFPEIPLTLGNKESNTTITIITSPFCRHCKKIHEIVERVLENHSAHLQIKIIMKTDLKTQSEDKTLFFRSLYSIYSVNNTKPFIIALKNWFINEDLKGWLTKFKLILDKDSDKILVMHNDWCELNELNFTPAIFINGYEYPKQYQREDLEYFINELIEDNFN